jgi:pyruvoyl-dependent arginine decarboxylase (PvlArgDC)
MEKLHAVNPALYTWIKEYNEDDTVEVSDKYPEEMYEEMVKEATTGESGCIKAIYIKTMEISAKSNKADNDVSAMYGAANL